MSPTQEVLNYSLKQDGTPLSDTNSKVVKFSVKEGDFIVLKLSKDSEGVYQFQDISSVGTGIIGGTITNSVDGICKVPAGAKYLIVSQLKTNVSNIVCLLSNKVDDEPTVGSDNLVKSGGVITCVNEISSGKIIIDGKNNAASYSKFLYQLMPNHRYVLHIINPDVDMTGVTVTGNFRLFALIGSTVVSNFSKSINNQLNTEYYYTYDGEEIASIQFGCRCTEGHSLILVFEDVTDKDNIETVEENQQAYTDNKSHELLNVINQTNESLQFNCAIRNGIASSIYSRAVTSEGTILFGDYDSVTIHTDRPNTEGCVYRYGYANYDKNGVASIDSTNRIYNHQPSFNTISNVIPRRTFYVGEAFALTIAEYNLSTEQVNTMTVDDFNGYRVWVEFHKSAKWQRSDLVSEAIGLNITGSYEFTQVSDFDRGSVQSSGSVDVSQTGVLVTKDWLRIRSRNGIKLSFPQKITYNEVNYYLRIRLIANKVQGSIGAATYIILNNNAVPSEDKLYTMLYSENDYHYLRMSVYLYTESDVYAGNDLSSEIWESVSELPISLNVIGGCASSLYNIGQIESDVVYIKEQINVDEPTDIVKVNEIVPTRRKFQQLKRTIKGTGNSSYTNRPNLILVHYSDIHQGKANIDRINEYCTYWKDNIDDVILTGDGVQSSFNQTTDEAWSEFWQGSEKTLFCIGNHDTAHYDSSTGYDWDYYIGQPAYERYFQPNIQQWSVVHDGNTSHCYYYKDYLDQKVRLIVIDVIGWDSNELEWFEGVLSNAITNELHVVVASHYPASMNFQQCSFTSLRSRLTLPSDVLPADALNAVDTFITNNGHFITWLTGHEHRDLLGTIQNHPNQLCVVIGTARATANTVYDNIERIVNTKSFDLFNVVSIDTIGMTLTLFRVGADLDMTLRHIGTLCYDYANKLLLWNN